MATFAEAYATAFTKAETLAEVVALGENFAPAARPELMLQAAQVQATLALAAAQAEANHLAKRQLELQEEVARRAQQAAEAQNDILQGLRNFMH